MSADDEPGQEDRLPLSVLLSQALVAFTIEFDNEFERQMPHRTTRHNKTGRRAYGLWLVSMVMWLNCMRFVGEEGVRVHELEHLARTPTNLGGMERWGYIEIEPDPDDNRLNPPRSDWLICATLKGNRARAIWQPLFGTIEQRWQERFGEEKVTQLREALRALVGQLDAKLPDCLPILGYGLAGKVSRQQRQIPAAETNARDLSLPVLLSKVLLAFTLDFESESVLSLAISANVLRLLDEKGVRVRDLPRLAGVSKESISMAQGFLEKRGCVMVQPEAPGSRTKVLALTARGRYFQGVYHQLVGAIEQRWHARFGQQTIERLRAALEQVVVRDGPESPLFGGLEPSPDVWRADIPRPAVLPHYPMVLHRGGFPDGS